MLEEIELAGIATLVSDFVDLVRKASSLSGREDKFFPYLTLQGNGFSLKNG